MLNWYALKTTPRWEKKIASLLSAKGHEVYCPLNKTIRQWSDRKKLVEEPLFKTFLFAKIEDGCKYELLGTKGVIGFVNYLGKPGIVREEEIITIKKFLSEFENIQTEFIQPAINSEVRINQGVLMNFKGLVVEVSGKLARVKLEGLGFALIATIEQRHLDVLKKGESISEKKGRATQHSKL